MLIGDKVLLRPMRISDSLKTIEWHNDVVNKFLTMSHPFPVTQELETEWITHIVGESDNKKITFAVERLDSSDIIGFVFLNHIDWVSRNCEWGALIGDTSCQKKGMGSEAVMLLLGYAFRFLNMKKVYARVLADHPATSKWLSSGAQIEGTLVKHFWHGTQYHDVNILAWSFERFFSSGVYSYDATSKSGDK